MDGQAAGGAVEDAVDEFADHGTGSRVLRDSGGPLMATTGWLALHQALIDHDAEYGGDGGGGDFAALSERLADFAERGRAAVPKGAEDFEFAIGGMLAGWAGHGEHSLS